MKVLTRSAAGHRLLTIAALSFFLLGDAGAQGKGSLTSTSSASKSLIRDIRMTRKELALQSMADARLSREHDRKVARAGLNGRDPLSDLAQQLSLTILSPSIAKKWGDGFVPAKGEEGVLAFHIVGRQSSDLREVRKLSNAMEVVYGGPGAEARVCLSGEGVKLAEAKVNRSSLKRIKQALGLRDDSMEPYRVMTGSANGQSIRIRESIDLPTREFAVLAKLVERGKPVKIRIEGGLKSASKAKRRKVAKKARQAAIQIAEGPDEGIVIWNNKGGKWGFVSRGNAEKTLSELTRLLKETNEFELTAPRISIEYQTVDFPAGSSGSEQSWRVGVIPSTADGGLLPELLETLYLNYRYSVEQEKSGCSIHVKMNLNERAIRLGPLSMRSFNELSELSLINYEKQDLLIGYLKEPNCKTGLPSSSLPKLTNRAFDRLEKRRSQCNKLCADMVSFRFEYSGRFLQSTCKRNCVERRGYLRCLQDVKVPPKIVRNGPAVKLVRKATLQDCQDRL